MSRASTFAGRSRPVADAQKAARAKDRRRKRNRTPAQVERDRLEHEARTYVPPVFGPHILAAATVATWLVIAAIVVACVAAVAGDAPARVRRPVGFDTISEGA